MKLVQDCLTHYYCDCGYNCAETIFCAACAAWELKQVPETLRLRGGFGGGMGTGNVCGAVTGAVAALSYRYVQGSGHTSPLLMAKVRLFMHTVRERLGDETCASMKPKYHTPDERCLPTIRLVAKILDEIELVELDVPAYQERPARKAASLPETET